jgi:hypothetical protein
VIYITQLFDEIIARLINFRIIRSEKLKKSGLLSEKSIKFVKYRKTMESEIFGFTVLKGM